MGCINFKVRSRKYNKYLYCSRLKKEITYEDCRQCKCKESKPVYVIKKKSSKLKKLEKERDKDITKKGICEYCHRYSDRLDPHEIYGGSNRGRSIKNNLVALICSECHKDENVILKLRKKKQKEFEKTHTREEFITLIGKSYL